MVYKTILIERLGTAKVRRICAVFLVGNQVGRSLRRFFYKRCDVLITVGLVWDVKLVFSFLMRAVSCCFNIFAC